MERTLDFLGSWKPADLENYRFSNVDIGPHIHEEKGIGCFSTYNPMQPLCDLYKESAGDVVMVKKGSYSEPFLLGEKEKAPEPGTKIAIGPEAVQKLIEDDAQRSAASARTVPADSEQDAVPALLQQPCPA